MPVDVVTGANTDRARDFVLDGPLPIPFWRYYDSRWHVDDRGLGFGHRHAFDHWLIFDLDGVTYRAADGHDCHFRHLLYDGERKTSGGYVLERVSSERYVLRHRAKRTLVFRRPTAIAFEAELAEIVDERAPHPERALLQYEGGRLAKILAPRDHTLRLEWDADGHLHGVQHRTPEGERTWLIRYEYERGFLVAGRDAYEQTFRLGYDANGRLARRMDRRGYSFLFEHDREGRCTSSAGEDGVMAVQLTYKPLEYETRVLDANGAEWVYQYNQAKVLLFVTDPYGGIRYFKTGEDGRLLAEFDAKSAPTRYVHDEAGAPIARITPKGEHIALPEGMNARPRHRVPRLPIEWDLGDLWQRGFGLPDPYETLVGVPGEIRVLLTTSESPSRGRVETHRDVQGLRVREEIESGSSRAYGYNENGGVRRVTDMEGGTWRIEHASWNHIATEIDPLGNEVHYEYSATEKLTAVVDAASTRTDYAYDLKDRLVEVRRAGPIRERYAYDEVGNLMEKRDGAGNVLMTLAYDHRGLLLKRTLASGDEHTFHYDERGQMIEAVALRHRCAFAHDALKRRILDKRDGRGVEHRYRGDALASTTVLDRFRTEYHHLPDGSVVIVDPTGHTHRVRSHGRGVFTRDFANGWSETVQYHPRGGRPLVKAFYRAEAPGERWERRYSYSAEGQLREAFDSERGRTQFAHDAALRLVATTHPDGRVDSYQYNRPGTLFQSPTLGQATVGERNRLRYANGDRLEHNERHHLASRASARGTLSFDYDSRDQLTGVFWESAEGQRWGWDAEYDPLGRRIRKSPGYTNDTTYYWDGDRLAAEVFATGALRVYVYPDAFAMMPMLFVDYESVDAPVESGKRYYVLTDQRSCVERVLDDTGAVVWKAQLDAYGYARIEVGHDFHQPLRFPGHWWDAELGLHYNRFRYYSPELGRYLQSDPWGLRGGLNLYAYTRNPLVQVDVRGLGCGDGEGGDEGEPEQPHPAEEEPVGGREHPQELEASEDESAARPAAEPALDPAEVERRNAEIRQWYNDQVGGIPELDAEWQAQGLSPEERARRAHAIRHDARVRAREMMPDQSQVTTLRARDQAKYGNPDGPTFDQLVDKHTREGMTRDEAHDAIIGSSQRTNEEYNQRFGAKRRREDE